MPSRTHSMTRVRVFSDHLLLDLVFSRSLFDEKFHRSPPIVMSSPCTVATIRVPLMQPCHTHGHAIPLVNLRSLSVDVSSSSQFCAASRATQAVLQQPAHVFVTRLVVLWRQFDEHSSSCWSAEVRPSHIDQCHNLSSFTHGDLRQHYFQRLQRRRRV